MRRLAQDPESLMKAVGKDLTILLKMQGRAAVQTTTIAANKRGLKADQIPYLFWTMAANKTLPPLGPRAKVYDLMLSIMDRTGVMPNSKAFKLIQDAGQVDETIDEVVVYMAHWAARTMVPALILGYYRILNKYASKVPAATGGEVHALAGVEYLDYTFREILTLRSAWFGDGELLRRVVRFIPE